MVRYSYLLENLKHKGNDARMYNLVFIARRVSVCFVYLFMYKWPGIQLQMTLLFNLFALIYTGQVAPFNTR